MIVVWETYQVCVVDVPVLLYRYICQFYTKSVANIKMSQNIQRNLKHNRHW